MPIKRYYLASLLALAMLVSAANAWAAAPIYHGNPNSYIFHAQHCRYFDCKNCVQVFYSRQQALKAGYRPCKVCKP